MSEQRKLHKGKRKQILVCYLSASWMRTESNKNITTELGTQLRMNRSIQSEGALSMLKQNYFFRRFMMRNKVNVKTEIILLAIVYDIKNLVAKIWLRNVWAFHFLRWNLLRIWNLDMTFLGSVFVRAWLSVRIWRLFSDFFAFVLSLYWKGTAAAFAATSLFCISILVFSYYLYSLIDNLSVTLSF